MNPGKRVLLFVILATGIYTAVSVAAIFSGRNTGIFSNVNLTADVFKLPAKKTTETVNGVTDSLLPAAVKTSNFLLYTHAGLITNFNADTTIPALAGFVQKLNALKSGKKIKIRIGYFGDSMIEGDLFTQTLRKLLQQQFGGSGVGYMPITSLVSQIRQSATSYASDGWQDDNFKTGSDGKLFVSGHLFRGNGDWVQMIDKSTTDTNILLEKSLLCGFAAQPVPVTVNNITVPVSAPGVFNRIPLANDAQHQVKLSVADNKLPIYGISFESASGIFVDNFSFRGISGVELDKIDTSLLNTLNNAGPYYDLLVFQYGVNVLFRPADVNFQWYGKKFMPVLKKMKQHFPNTDIVVVGTGDRAFSYNGTWQSATGIDSLIKIQAGIAAASGCSFYNLYQSMGGKNTIVQWATATPSLANKDYVHPNIRGAEILGTRFYDALMKDYNKYKPTTK